MDTHLNFINILKQNLTFCLCNTLNTPNTQTRFKGSGFFNNVINNLPFELHLPGHKFTGPGTNLHLRLERGDIPINNVDKNAMIHDIDYSENKDVKHRVLADEDFIKRNENIINNSNSFKEKAEAFSANTMIQAKNFFGNGLDKHKIIKRFNNYLSNNNSIIKETSNLPFRKQVTDENIERLRIFCRKNNFKCLI